MQYKSFGEMFLSELMAKKKKEDRNKEVSTQRLQKRRAEALKKFNETGRDDYAEQVRFYDKIIDHSEAKTSGTIGLIKKNPAW